ncbi:helix-turn-helix transcriptional regulator [Ferruginivarius sediminum]|uniref:XRE family transcriptional regulator n=1 Tax=Ferruginivarius sediminum TaxID=2661937 RepID=A0A369TFI6_9PROT|nr:helix-turn-helix transcriptional regulator [Ferruginivarius sediminum]RDD62887.1 XRE family transcriptional regulator [Ferruginivarius sediminum]
MSLTPEQCRAARVFLRISQKQLADAAGVSVRTISHFEAGDRTPVRATVAALRRALEDAGIEFLDGDSPGLRLHSRARTGR